MAYCLREMGAIQPSRQARRRVALQTPAAQKPRDIRAQFRDRISLVSDWIPCYFANSWSDSR